jgi:hypothetical protein
MQLKKQPSKFKDHGSICGVEIIPATKIFFRKFDYKIALEGNRVCHDIVKHDAISTFLAGYPDKKVMDSWNKHSRKIYTSNVSILSQIIKWWPELVLGIEGIIDADHQKKIANLKKNDVAREKLYFDKYDLKIDMFEAAPYQNYNGGKAPAWFTKLKGWTKSQDMNCTITVSRNSEGNVARLYTDSEEYRDFEGFFLIQFHEYVTDETRCIKI